MNNKEYHCDECRELAEDDANYFEDKDEIYWEWLRGIWRTPKNDRR